VSRPCSRIFRASALALDTLCVAAALTLLPGCFSGCTEKTSNAAPDSNNPKPGFKTVKFDAKALERNGVKVDVAGSSSSSERLQVPGSLEYNLEKYAEVGTLLEGRVQTINAKVGDKVKRGQLLATVVVPSIAAAQADFVSAEAAVRNAQTNLEREEALFAKQLTTAKELEDARREATKSKADLAAASAKLQALGVAKPGASGIVQGAGTLVLTAPLDGVVIKREAVLGRFLSPQEQAFVIADPTALRATVNVYEGDLIFFSVGADVDVTFDALPGKLVRGKVSVIEPQLGRQTRSVRALIDVPNEDGVLRPGLFLRASVKLPEDMAKAKLLVPKGAVQPLGDDNVVFVELQPGTFEVRKVQVARETPQIVEIASGIQRGERIAVEGAFLLRGEVTKQ
jgi:cobalt-zinc-cadmium efflux system membrane fusion protein